MVQIRENHRRRPHCSERDRGVDAAPENLVLAFAHVTLVSKRVRRRPGVVYLRTDREPLREGILGGESQRLVGKFRIQNRTCLKRIQVAYRF